ncbi:MAG: S8 family peptidase [Saprospiraceae bacterium]|uniref:S8 family peptidase n=1 Tax=Candidatus Opimibacter skivensis TaxID=2982028 RepID=A0A9D7SRR9_9BACT|nr:S8 family peptidase [Candidatus Opimibacter skivensis]
MKNVVSFIFFLLVGHSLFAQHAIMPASTHAAIEVIQRDLSHNRSKPSQQVVDFYPIYKTADHYDIAVLCKINSSFNKTQAVKDGFDIGAVIGSIASMRMPLHFLQEGFAYPGIDYIEVAEKIAPELDGAIKDIRADLVHKGVDLPQPYTGKNVIIGIVDWGFDYTHPMFYDTTLDHTRIMAAWDQVKVIGTPPAGFSHGAVYTDADQLAAAQHDTLSPLTDYHATHVAGIAGGSGAGTKYRGVGFESDFLFSQMRNDVSSSLDAYQWMYNISQSTGKRLVVNNSWGNYRLFPLDGTSLMSQAIDAFSALGVVFVFSGGNNGNINFHLKKSFVNDSVRTRIGGFDYTNDHDLWGQSIAMWGEAGNSFSAQLRILNDQNQLIGQSDLINTSTASAYIDTFMVIGPDTIFYHVTTDAAHPLNGRPQMTLDIQSKNAALKKILYAEASTGTVHFWNTRLTTYGIGNWGYGFTAPTTGYVNGDKNYGIGHPGVTNSVITAAAHETNFLLTSFSSYGPRIDEVIKPDISAPGLNIISSFNSFSKENVTPVTSITFNGKTYEFIKLSGTSMSAPMVTGSVALILEANPTLSAAEIKQIIINSAFTDGLTGAIGPEGNNRWGHGKLDVYKAIQLITGSTAIGNISESKKYLFPNPAHDEVYVTSELDGNETYRLNRLDGALISSGHFDGALSVAQIPDGIYILSIENSNSFHAFKLVINK